MVYIWSQLSNKQSWEPSAAPGIEEGEDRTPREAESTWPVEEAVGGVESGPVVSRGSVSSSSKEELKFGGAGYSGRKSEQQSR